MQVYTVQQWIVGILWNTFGFVHICFFCNTIASRLLRILFLLDVFKVWKDYCSTVSHNVRWLHSLRFSSLLFSLLTQPWIFIFGLYKLLFSRRFVGSVYKLCWENYYKGLETKRLETSHDDVMSMFLIGSSSSKQ